VAGHEAIQDAEGQILLIDSHGDPVGEPVFELLEHVICRGGMRPVLVERDNDIPPLPELLRETDQVRQIMERAACAAVL
jgi:uncharacterized protein (UPF0276 family)